MHRDVAVDVPVSESTIRRVVARITPYSGTSEGKEWTNRRGPGFEGSLERRTHQQRRSGAIPRSGRENSHGAKWSESGTMRLQCGEGTVMEKDVVCGMQVDPAKAAAASEYQGKTYYFCSKACKIKFDSNPAQYVK